MLTSIIIKQLYKRYESPKCNIGLEELASIVEKLNLTHGLIISEEQLIVPSLSEDSPFHSLPIDNIRGIAEFESVYALVLPSCIVFFDKNSSDINVHIKFPEESLFETIKTKIAKVFNL